MKSAFVYPIIVVVLGGLYLAFEKAFNLDYPKMLQSLSFEDISFWVAVIVIISVVVGDITHSIGKKKERDNKRRCAQLESELQREKELASTYKYELERRSHEDFELENLRAIHRHHRDEKKEINGLSDEL